MKPVSGFLSLRLGCSCCRLHEEMDAITVNVGAWGLTQTRGRLFARLVSLHSKLSVNVTRSGYPTTDSLSGLERCSPD